jgi:hypothetical protein
MHADIIICFMWLFAWATPTDMAIESAATASVFSIMSSSIVPRTAGMILKDLTRLLLTQFRVIRYSRADRQCPHREASPGRLVEDIVGMDRNAMFG